MDKQKLLDQIQEYLKEELSDAEKAEPAGERVKEIKSLLLMYRFLPVRNYTAEDVIVPSALVELKLGSATAYYYVAPQGGGLITKVDDRAVQVITPNSPLGEKLLGKKVGDLIHVETRSGTREYQVVSLV
ncbi:MAG: GreA/GreB family elongation factor [Methylotenera sp.]|nr:GreA/GreB family elongation factor [Oligoflexia bacterium]